MSNNDRIQEIKKIERGMKLYESGLLPKQFEQNVLDDAYLLSEVERLQRENERISNEMDSLMIALEDRAPYAAQKYWTYLLNEKEKLVEALEWYADEINWNSGCYEGGIFFTLADDDSGEKARTALSHLKG